MAYTFTAQEQNSIKAARLLCTPGDDPKDVKTNGNWVPFYTALSNIIGQHIAAGDITNPVDLANFKSSKLWLDVAIGANGGTGMHSAFIRTYTDRQGLLRRGSPFSATEMQKASNGVALNFYRDIAGLSKNPDVTPWTAPSIDVLAKADASSIGRNLFGEGSTQPLSSDDDAATQNSAWTGTLGFNLLGGAAPFESWRLLVDGDETKTTAKLDSLDDFKNLLYAVDSYQTALKAGYAVGGVEFIAYLATIATAARMRGRSVPAAPPPDLVAQLNISFASGDFFGFVKDVASRTPAISPAINVIADVGSNKFLDMLMGAAAGQCLLGSTTDANFASRAKDFFNSYGSALPTTEAKLLPANAGALASLAKTDVNVRAALVALSGVSVRVPPSVANQLSLYDASTGQGFTDAWLQDRSAMLSWELKVSSDDARATESQPYAPDIGLGLTAVPSLYFADVASGERLYLGGQDRRYVVFGSEQADAIAGRGDNDRLYGGGGSDTLWGDTDAHNLAAPTDNPLLWGNNYLDGAANSVVTHIRYLCVTRIFDCKQTRLSTQKLSFRCRLARSLVQACGAHFIRLGGHKWLGSSLWSICDDNESGVKHG
jgi:hypothetical protein